MTTERAKPFALGDWIVEPEFHTLVQGDTSHSIEPRVLSVLLELASHAGRVVSKEEFLRVVWPNTFVSEDALTRCISVLRHILQDDPHYPKFIKTVPKVGYCLLMEVRPIAAIPSCAIGGALSSGPFAGVSDRQATVLTEDPPGPFAASEPVILHKEPTAVYVPNEPSAPWMTRRKVPAVATACFLLVVFCVGMILLRRDRHSTAFARVSVASFRLTTDAGEENRPALSPDGEQLALVWKKEGEERQQIYINQMGREPLRRLTNLDDEEFSPVWSPEGRSIAFLSHSDAGLALYVSPVDAATKPKKLYIPGAMTRWEQGALAWSPDGRYLVVADHLGGQPSSSLYQVDTQTLSVRALTSSPTGWEGDVSPAYSPDGARIAFLRASESAVADIYWIPASGGAPQRVTHDESMINGITWSSASRAIVFSSNRSGEYSLWRVGLNGSAPERMPLGTEDATQPAISRNGKVLTFVEGSAVFGIRGVEESNPADRGKTADLVASTAQDSAPSVSPDGARFAFQSWRSGSQQIWTAAWNGSSLQQVSTERDQMSGSGSPSWSPGGDQIAFDSRIAGHSHIFLLSPRGGSPRQLTFSEVNDIVPRWSLDGRFIYFRSNRGGRWQLWKIPAAGGMPQPVTRDDGMAAQESEDGKWLFFSRGGEPGIWRMPASGGEEVRVLDQPSTEYWAYWAVRGGSLYFLDGKRGAPAISVYDIRTQKVMDFAQLDRLPPLYAGLSVLPGGRKVLISDMHDAGSHISIAHGAF